MNRLAPSLLNLLLMLALLTLLLLSLSIGSVPLALGDIGRALLSSAASGADLADVRVQQQVIVNEIRLPRVLLAILVGMSLGAAGAALKGGGLSTALLCGALFGLFTYATYDLTNQATLRNWSTLITVVDIAWGSFLGAVTAAGAWWITQRVLGT